MATIKLAKSGKWSATATWSTKTVPTEADDVVLTGAFKLEVSAEGSCRSLTCESFTGELNQLEAGTLNIGDTIGKTEPPSNIILKLESGFTYKSAALAVIKLVAGTASEAKPEKVWTAGYKIPSLQFGAATTQKAFYRLEEACTGIGVFKATSKVTVETNGFRVEPTGQFLTTVSPTINLGASEVVLANSAAEVVWELSNETTLTAGTSVIKITDTGTNEKRFAGVGKTYATLLITGNKVQIIGSNIFKALKLENAGTAEGTLLTEGTTQTIEELVGNGKAGSLVFLQSNVAGKAAKLKCSSKVSVDYFKVKDNTAEGDTPFYCGAHGELVSGTTNWKAETPGEEFNVKLAGRIKLQGTVQSQQIQAPVANGQLKLHGTVQGQQIQAPALEGRIVVQGKAAPAQAHTVNFKGEVKLQGKQAPVQAQSATAKGQITIQGKAALAQNQGTTVAGVIKIMVRGSMNPRQTQSVTGSTKVTIQGKAPFTQAQPVAGTGRIKVQGAALMANTQTVRGSTRLIVTGQLAFTGGAIIALPYLPGLVAPSEKTGSVAPASLTAAVFPQQATGSVKPSTQTGLVQPSERSGNG